MLPLHDELGYVLVILRSKCPRGRPSRGYREVAAVPVKQSHKDTSAVLEATELRQLIVYVPNADLHGALLGTLQNCSCQRKTSKPNPEIHRTTRPVRPCGGLSRNVLQHQDVLLLQAKQVLQPLRLHFRPSCGLNRSNNFYTLAPQVSACCMCPRLPRLYLYIYIYIYIYII